MQESSAAGSVSGGFRLYSALPFWALVVFCGLAGGIVGITLCISMPSSENSIGFHSPQEATRVLANALDFARQAQLAAVPATLKK